MYTLSGHVPEHVPHWMQRTSWSQPGTAITSRPKPFTRSDSYLIVHRTLVGASGRRSACTLGALTRDSAPPAAGGVSTLGEGTDFIEVFGRRARVAGPRILQSL